jgi:hypothetical protein
MPRLIPRLLKRLQDAPADNSKRISVAPVRRRRIISFRGPSLPPPSLSPFGRTRSILLEDVNPVINTAAYTRHKSLPPRLRIHKAQRRRAVDTNQDELPRRMTQEERRWWASPYCTWKPYTFLYSLRTYTLQYACYPVQ